MSRLEDARTAIAAHKAKNGVNWIKQNIPDGLAKINLGTLNVADRNLCALAQATGKEYATASCELLLPTQLMVECGFLVYNAFNPQGPMKEWARAEYALLTAAWKKVIRMERRADAVHAFADLAIAA